MRLDRWPIPATCVLPCVPTRLRELLLERCRKDLEMATHLNHRLSQGCADKAAEVEYSIFRRTYDSPLPLSVQWLSRDNEILVLELIYVCHTVEVLT